MYVVIGANGFLGSYVIKNILEMTDEKILAVRKSSPGKDTDRVKWVFGDISNPLFVEQLNKEHLDTSDSNKIVYLAAYHHPDLVEKNPKLAWDINVTALSRFINSVDKMEKFFYPSSDSVYGESEHGYRFKETDPLNPVNRYGHHKCAAESIVTEYGYNIVRYPFLIAPSLAPGKQHFYDTIVHTLGAGRQIEMFKDSMRSALDFDTAARLLIQLMENGPVPQKLNVCGDEDLSKYDIGIRIADKLRVSRDLVKPISVDNSAGIFEVKRASSTLMDNSLLKQTLGLTEIRLKL
ncbi:NAD(P)-dependent oxidoreductase [uncultured Mailhella sp.]|uniref:NAD-dependent epimerase/dehydratase family protein n=1 Tax=uncultured Mailhella sp. TaxID=1981031 RepID=UPI0026376676|nr:NAD(P)-dependent oxidoreductase [uncultured Mailhella sp.]